MAAATPRRFAGVTSPNTTQVPDQYLDELLPVLSGAELKVLLYITRRTFGFKKASDNISLSQMLSGIVTRDGRRLDAGVGLSKKTLLRALTSLKAQHIILTERRRSVARGDEPTTYRLNIIAPSAAAEATVGEDGIQGGGGEMPPGGRGSLSPTQQTGKQKTVRQQTASSKFLSSNGGGGQSGHGGRPPALSEYPTLLITEFSAEFGDAEHVRANCTRGARLLAWSAQTEQRFTQALHEARSITRDECHRRGRGGGAAPIRKPMPFFWRVVEDLLGLRPAPEREEAA